MNLNIQILHIFYNYMIIKRLHSNVLSTQYWTYHQFYNNFNTHLFLI